MTLGQGATVEDPPDDEKVTATPHVNQHVPNDILDWLLLEYEARKEPDKQ